MREIVSKNGKEYLHIAAAARLSGYSSGYIRALCAKEEIAASKVAGAWYVDKKSLLKSIKGLQAKQIQKETTHRSTRKEELKAIQQRQRSARRVVGSEITFRKK